VSPSLRDFSRNDELQASKSPLSANTPTSMDLPRRTAPVPLFREDTGAPQFGMSISYRFHTDFVFSCFKSVLAKELFLDLGSGGKIGFAE